MTTEPTKSFSVSGSGETVLHFRGHPRYDAVRVDLESGDTGATSTDVTVKVDSNDEQVSFGSMDATVVSSTGIDASSNDKSVGTTAVARRVAVKVSPGSSGAGGTVTLHNSSDPAQNAQAFVDR